MGRDGAHLPSGGEERRMSFSLQWLALREPYDRAARNPAVLEAVRTAFAGRPVVRVVDLGCGTGSTMRAVAPLLPGGQAWRLVDNDIALLDAAVETTPAIYEVTTAHFDLADDLGRAIADDTDLVATSALLDLVSGEWLERLVSILAISGRPVYAALSFDGRVDLTPACRDDAAIIAAVNLHQLTDKGFGPALGPHGGMAAVAALQTEGFAIAQGASDWVFGPADVAIQREMLAGWAGAAEETGIAASLLDAWLAERHAHIAAGRSAMRIGHLDFFAAPIGTR
jgi:SAM-dependent methyltransferase